MATWKKANGKPVTTESEIRVYDEAGREGYLAISRELVTPQGVIRSFGQVYAERFDGDHDTRRTVLDAEPKFAC